STSAPRPSLTRRPPSPPRSPYTTLFRSQFAAATERVTIDRRDPRLARAADEMSGPAGEHVVGVELGRGLGRHFLDVRPRGEGLRSEEHTSELQSRENLVCRLLLEKKKAL